MTVVLGLLLALAASGVGAEPPRPDPRPALVTMEVGGLTGVVASVLGKEPPDLRFWVSAGAVPAFLRFERRCS